MCLRTLRGVVPHLRAIVSCPGQQTPWSLARSASASRMKCVSEGKPSCRQAHSIAFTDMLCSSLTTNIVQMFWFGKPYQI
jgi:hypothetical protein